jgi:bifunctional non-homologous end joining protein LigD
MSKARRKGRIFVDWVRNIVEATAIASYSVRARPGAPVAFPLAWDELRTLREPPHESLREARLRLRVPDPWAPFEASRRVLSRRALRLVSPDGAAGP